MFISRARVMMSLILYFINEVFWRPILLVLGVTLYTTRYLHVGYFIIYTYKYIISKCMIVKTAKQQPSRNIFLIRWMFFLRLKYSFSFCILHSFLS